MSRDEQPGREAPRRPSRWRRRLALAAGAAAALLLALRAALPFALERAVPIGAERFGLAATLRNVDLGLLQGHVTLEGLRVAPLAPTTSGAEAPELLRLGRLFVDFEWLGLLRGKVEIAELLLEQPALVLVRAADGYLELPALPPSTEREPVEPPAEAPGEPMPVILHSFTLRDSAFRLVDAAGGEDLIDLHLTELGLGELRLVGAELDLGGLQLSEPRLAVRRDVQNTRLGARGAPAEDPAPADAGDPAPAEAEAPAPEEEEASGPPALRIDAIDVERAEFAVVTEDEPIALTLRLHTSDVSFARETPFPFELRIEVGDGSLALLGQLGLNPPHWDGKLSWDALDVPLLVRAAMPELIPWIRSCAASGELDVKLTPRELRASGGGSIDAFALEDPEEELAISWKALAIELREATLPLGAPAEPMQLSLGKITLDSPSTRYVLPNTAFERLAAIARGPAEGEGAPAEPAAPPEAAPPPPRIRIDAIQLRGGKAEFVDRSGDEPYEGRVNDLSVTVRDLRLPERTVGKLRVRGIAPERAPFDLTAALPGTEGSARLELERLPLAQFTPYASRAADLRIPAGELSLDTTAKLARSGAAGTVESKLRVHRLRLDGATDTITVAGLPLSLVLALLRDPRGDIALGVPLRYGDAGTKTEFTTVLRSALTAAIKGAVSTPLKAAGAFLPKGGGAAISFEPIPFAPGSAALTSETRKRLASVARLLGERPALGLTLLGRAGAEDRDVLAERLLIDRVGAGEGLAELDDDPFFARRRIQAALEARARGEPGALAPEDAPLFARYVAATEVPSGRFEALAKARADAVRGRLEGKHGVSATRLDAGAAPAPGAPEVVLGLRLGSEEEPGEGAAGVR